MSKQGFFERKKIKFSLKAYFIDAMGAMAYGLFASLLIGTILGTIGTEFNIPILVEIANYAKSVTGAAIGVAIAMSLNAPLFVVVSVAAVGMAGNSIGSIACAYIASIIATEVGKMVSKETKIDIILTPTVTISVGVLIAKFIGPYIANLMSALGVVIMQATEMQPFLMGIIVAVIVGMVLTLPISSAALCIMLDLSGLAAGAATAGCAAQMIGFAIASYKENGFGGFLAQGIGTSMLQVPNIFKNPFIWVAPTLASVITGPVATVVFKMENISTAAGMGTSGFVGPIGVFTAQGVNVNTITSVVVVCFVLPAILAFIFDKGMRKIGLVKDGDMKLDI